MHAGVLQLCHSGNVEVREELARISPLLPLWPLNWGHQAWWQTPLCKAALISYPRQCLWTAQNEPANPDPDPCSVFTILKAWYILHVNLKRSFIICKPEVAGFQSQTLASPRMVQWSLQYWLWHFEQRRTFFLSVQKAFHQDSPYRASTRTSKRHRCGVDILSPSASAGWSPWVLLCTALLPPSHLCFPLGAFSTIWTLPSVRLSSH